MPGIDFSAPLVSASAGAATDWGSVDSEASVQFTGELAANRGLVLDLGISALARMDGNIRKFLAADLEGEAHASAQITGQVQLPMNLFKEAGLAVRLQAKAEAAAGVKLRLGLSIGDFIALVESDPHMVGLPIELFKVFMEEVHVGGGLYAKVAASAMAYANVILAGRLIPTDTEDAGFTISGEAGAGLKAGGGFKVFANMGLTDPRRLLRKSIDLIVDHIVNEISGLLPPEDEHSKRILGAFRAPAKIGLRTAFEVGELIGTGKVPQDANGAKQLSLRCTQVVLEEAQAFLLNAIIRVGIEFLHNILEAADISENDWNNAVDERLALAAALGAIPDKPIKPTPESIKPYERIVYAGIALADKLGGTVAQEWRQPMTMIWCGAQLIYLVFKQTANAEAAAYVIGLPPQETKASFDLDMSDVTVPETIRETINESLGYRPTDQIDNAQLLVKYLSKEAILDPLVLSVPEAKMFLDLFKGPLGDTAIAVAEMILMNASSLPIGGNPDPKATLEAIAGGMQQFLVEYVESQLIPQLESVLPHHPQLQLYFDEIVVPALKMSIRLVFKHAANWEDGPINSDVLSEALSGVMFMIFGRSLVVSLDVLLAEGQKVLKDEMLEVADIAEEDRNDSRNIVPILAAITGLPRDELADLSAETIRIAADVFGPLPDSTRCKIRQLLYEIIEPLPSGEPTDFADALGDTFFVPNLDLLQELAFELGGYAADSFSQFVTRVLQRLAELALEAILDLINELLEQVHGFLNDLEKVINDLAQRLAELTAEIVQLIEDVQEEFDRVMDKAEHLLSLMSSRSYQDKVIHEVTTEAINQAFGVLGNIDIYKNLPRSLRREAKRLVRNSVRGLIANKITDAALDAVAEVAVELDDFVNDVRRLDPYQDLRPQLRSLILDRVESSVRSKFGGSNPKFDIEISFSTLFGDVDIDLGQVIVPINKVCTIVRWGFGQISAFGDRLDALAEVLAEAFGLEAILVERECEKELVSREKREADRQMAESQPRDLEISIVEPTPGGAYQNYFRVHILFAGAPMSYAGRGENEQSRILICLNGEHKNLQLFDIEESQRSWGGGQPYGIAGEGTPTGVDTMGRTTGMTRRSGVSMITSMFGKETRHLGRGVEQESDLVTVRQVRAWESLGTWGERKADASREVKDKDQPLLAMFDGESTKEGAGLTGHWASQAVIHERAKSSLRTTQHVPGFVDDPCKQKRQECAAREILKGAGRARAGAGRASGKPIFFAEPAQAQGDSTAAPFTLGKTLTLTQVGTIESNQFEGLRLTATFDASDLVEGLNTLVVAIVDGRGQEIKESVAFFMVKPSAEVGDDNGTAEPGTGYDSTNRIGPDRARPREKKITLPSVKAKSPPAALKKVHGVRLYAGKKTRAATIKKAKQHLKKEAAILDKNVGKRLTAIKARRAFNKKPPRKRDQIDLKQQTSIVEQSQKEGRKQ